MEKTALLQVNARFLMEMQQCCKRTQSFSGKRYNFVKEHRVSWGSQCFCERMQMFCGRVSLGKAMLLQKNAKAKKYNISYHFKFFISQIIMSP